MSGPVRRFAASDQGSLIGPYEWTGVVLAAHTRVVNVLREDGLVVSFVADPGAMAAMSVLVQSSFFQPGNTLPGRGVVRKGPNIEIADIAQIDLTQSRPWEGTIDEAAISDLPVERVSAVHDALLAHGKADGLLGILSAGMPANPFVRKAREALSERRFEELVGLGPGLTPAGDDLLTGALLVSAGLPGRRQIEAALSGTTPGGRTLLWMALRRSFPAYLVAFADSVSHAGSAHEVGDAVRAACAHGETSGTDSLTGFCWALQDCPSERGRVHPRD